MKKLLSLLLILVFLQNQSWAVKGGPEFDNGAGGISTAGTYAGALLPTGSSKNVATASGFNGLGIFAIVIPAEGLGTGNFFYFSSGNAFAGTVAGIADPDQNSFVAVINGTASITVASGFSNDGLGDTSAFTDSLITATVGGGLTASFSQNGSGSATSTGVRIAGQADLEITTPGQTASTTTDANGNTVTVPAVPSTTSELVLVVDGFQQSTDTTALSGTGFPTLPSATTGS